MAFGLWDLNPVFIFFLVLISVPNELQRSAWCQQSYHVWLFIYLYFDPCSVHSHPNCPFYSTCNVSQSLQRSARLGPSELFFPRPSSLEFLSSVRRPRHKISCSQLHDHSLLLLGLSLQGRGHDQDDQRRPRIL